MIRWEVILRGPRGFRDRMVVEAANDSQARRRALRASSAKGNPPCWADECCQRPDTTPLTPRP